MQRPMSRALGVALSLVVVASCSGNPEDTIEPPTTSGGEVTGGQIIVGGDLTDATTSTAEPPAPATSSTAAPTRASTTSTRPTTTVPRSATTTRPTTTTRPATTSRPTTTEAEVVGDGPVLTAPGSGGSSEAPGVSNGLAPAFFAIEVNAKIACATATPGTATLRWEVIGTEAVDIAIGTSKNIFRLAQPPAGTLDVPLDCAKGSTYFVVASNPEGSTTRSVKLAADATA